MFFPKVFLWILIWIIGGLVVPVLFRFFQAFLWDLGDLKWLFCTVCLSCSLGFCIVILALGGSLPVGNSLNSPLEFCIFFLVVWWWLFCRVSLNYSLGFCIGVLVVWWKLFCRVFSKIFLWIWHWTWCFLVMAFHIFFLEFALDLFLLFHFCMVFCPLLHFSMDFVCVVGGFFVGCFLSFSGLCNGIWWGWWWLFLALSMPRQEQRGLDCDCLAVFSGLSHNETWALSKAQSSPGYMQPPSVFRWPLEFLPEL